MSLHRLLLLGKRFYSGYSGFWLRRQILKDVYRVLVEDSTLQQLYISLHLNHCKQHNWVLPGSIHPPVSKWTRSPFLLLCVSVQCRWLLAVSRSGQCSVVVSVSALTRLAAALDVDCVVRSETAHQSHCTPLMSPMWKLFPVLPCVSRQSCHTVPAIVVGWLEYWPASQVERTKENRVVDRRQARLSCTRAQLLIKWRIPRDVLLVNMN